MTRLKSDRPLWFGLVALIAIFATFIHCIYAVPELKDGVPVIAPNLWKVRLERPTSNCMQPTNVIIELENEEERAQFAAVTYYELTRYDFITVELFSEWNTTNDVMFLRNVPVANNAQGQFIASFFPELSARRFKIVVHVKGAPSQSSASKGVTVETHTLRSTLDVRDGCATSWGGLGCVSILGYPYPIASNFVLLNADGTIITPGATLSIPGLTATTFIIRPLPITKKLYPDNYKHFTFNVFLKSASIIKAAEHIDYVYDDGVDGYTFSLKPMENEEYMLYSYFHEVHGDNDQGVKPFAFHMPPVEECNRRQGNVPGIPIKIIVTDGMNKPVLGQNPKGLPRCTTGEHKGRWLHIPLDQECDVPYCSGTRRGVVNIPNHESHFVLAPTGERSPFVWVPYSCYYHLFNAYDIMHCAAQKDWHWYHVIGDSTTREVATNTMATFRRFDSFKFEQVSNWVQKTVPDATYPFRLSYEFLHPMYELDYGKHRDFKLDQFVLDQYNLVGNTSTGGKSGRATIAKEEGRPNILVLSSAVVYAIWKQPWEDYKAWSDKLADYLKPWSEEPESDKKMRIVWYNGPYLHNPPHEYKWEISAVRIKKYNDYTASKLRPLGVRIAEVWPLGQPRPEGAWDGTHYSRGANGKWLSPISHMMTQIAHNIIFDFCTGDGTRILEDAKGPRLPDGSVE